MKTHDQINERISELEVRRVHYLEHAAITLTSEDFHGVQDAGSDLRDIDSELSGLRWVLEQ